MRSGLLGLVWATRADGTSNAVQSDTSAAIRVIYRSFRATKANVSLRLDSQSAHELLDGRNLGPEPRGKLIRRAADDLIAGPVRLLARLRRLECRLAHARQQRDDLGGRSRRREQRVERIRNEAGKAGLAHARHVG